MVKGALKKRKEKNGTGEWVFSTRNNTPVRCHNLINRSWYPLLEKMGLPKIPFHNLRHTCATLLLSKGVHPKIVQELLEHATINVILDTYSHILPGMGYAAASAMDDALG